MADIRLILKYRSAVLLVVSFLLVLQTVKGGPDPSICDSNQIINSPTPKRPQLPDTYRVTIEANIENRNYTTDYTEFYDGVHEMGVTHQWFLGFDTQTIYSPGTNELFTVEPQLGTCTTDKLSTSGPKYIFGYQPSTSHSGRLFTAAGALRFGNGTNEQYMGQTRVRGIIADEWKSCMYWPDMDATMEVHWYFAATSAWSPATGKTLPSPLRCQVHGMVHSGKPHPFNHTYEFSGFEDSLGPAGYHVFQVPSGIVCPNRQNTKPLPTPSSHFVFNTEALNMDFKTIGFIKEWYSYDMDLVRYDYKPQPTDVKPYGDDFLSEVHDFSEGIAYIRDTIKGNCTMTTILGHNFDAETKDAVHVRIRSTQQFFDFDKASYQYEGVKRVRGMDCDVWIAIRSDWPPGTTGQNSTFEWYFARQGWRESTGRTYVFGMPVQFKINSDNYGSYVYNMYNFDDEKLKSWDFDISSCYNYTDRQDFAFKIPGSYQNVVAKDYEAFKYNVILAVHKTSTVSALRISDVRIDYDDSNILVSLSILGAAPIQGNAASPIQQTSLSAASQLLTNAINSNQLTVSMNLSSFTKTIRLTAQPYSLTQKSHTVQKKYYVKPSSSAKYSAGSVAGLGVAMAVVFFAFGFLCMYIYYRKNGGSFTKNIGGGFEPKKLESDYENTSEKSGDA